MARRLDERRPPEARLVLEGPILDQLRHGTRITPNGQRVDVTPPSQRPGAERAFGWNPRDLELSLEQLRERFDPDTWAVFSRWAADTEIADGVTVYQWLSQPALLSRAPAQLRAWKRLGFPPFIESASSPATVANLDPDVARGQLLRGNTFSDPSNVAIAMDARVLEHWEKETRKNPGDIQGRLRLLPGAEATLRDPDEVWQQKPGRRVYLKAVADGEQVRAMVVIVVSKAEEHWVRTYYQSWSRDYADSIRDGGLLYRKGRAGGQPPSPSGG